MLHVTRHLFALLILSLLLSACSSDAPQPAVNDDTEGSRFISLAPHLTEIMFAAGAGKSLIGVVRYSDYPPAATQIPLIGDAFPQRNHAVFVRVGVADY
jgi:ABC-type hemin transport system substrate-binding protein